MSSVDNQRLSATGADIDAAAHALEMGTDLSLSWEELCTIAELVLRSQSLRASPISESSVSDALAEAKREALYLANTLHRLHYPEVTQWQPLDDVAGIISQIDNMVAGLVKPSSIPSPKGEPVAEGKETALLQVVQVMEKALQQIASSHPERVGYDQTDIEEIPDLSAEEALSVARKALGKTGDTYASQLPPEQEGDVE